MIRGMKEWGVLVWGEKTLTPRPLPPALVGIARVAVFVAGGRGGWGVVCGGDAGERRSLESLRAFQCHPERAPALVGSLSGELALITLSMN